MQRQMPPTPTGLIVVDKPLGWSSMDVIRRLRRALAMGMEAGLPEGSPRMRLKKIKAGHAGTLDPLATGVVVCCCGKATRQVERIMGLTKVYETIVDLSAFTTTDDMEGEREEVHIESPPTRDVIECRLSERFVGEVEQRPPAFSAVHVDGKRAYKLARRGEVVELPTRRVRIDAVEVLDYVWPRLSLRITCGKGTYIRSIARELGESLGTGGHLASLRRTAVGPYRVEDAVGEQRLTRAIVQADLMGVPEGRGGETADR